MMRAYFKEYGKPIAQNTLEKAVEIVNILGIDPDGPVPDLTAEITNDAMHMLENCIDKHP